MKDYARAQEALKRYVKLFPGDTFMRNMPEKVEVGQTLVRSRGGKGRK